MKTVKFIKIRESIIKNDKEYQQIICVNIDKIELIRQKDGGGIIYLNNGSVKTTEPIIDRLTNMHSVLMISLFDEQEISASAKNRILASLDTIKNEILNNCSKFNNSLPDYVNNCFREADNIISLLNYGINANTNINSNKGKDE